MDRTINVCTLRVSYLRVRLRGTPTWIDIRQNRDPPKKDQNRQKAAKKEKKTDRIVATAHQGRLRARLVRREGGRVLLQRLGQAPAPVLPVLQPASEVGELRSLKRAKF